MHVAILDEWLPYPVNNGKRLRTYNLVVPLAERHQITYISHRNHTPKEQEDAAAHLRDRGIDVVLVDRRVPRDSGPLFYARLAKNLCSPLPYSVQRHTSSEMQAAVRQLAMSSNIDLWQVEWTPYAQNLKGIGQTPWIVNAHNVESQIWQRFHEAETNPAKAWYIQKQCVKYSAFERAVFGQANCIVAVSEEDAQLASDRFAAQAVRVVSNGVDIDYFTPSELDRNPRELLFLGSMGWRPNLDAVQALLDRIFPEILQQIPDAQLTVVGHSPPSWLVARAKSSSNVTLHGSVPDVRPYLSRCGAMVVPLRIGGGSRLKILESLASGCPVISTSVGAEGLRLVPGTHYFRVSDIDHFAAQTVQALRDYESLRKGAQAGGEVVRRLYDWKHLACNLEKIWELYAAESVRAFA